MDNYEITDLSQSNDQTVCNVNNSVMSSSRASLVLVDENPGKLAVDPGGAICTPTPCKLFSSSVLGQLKDYGA